MDAEHQIVTADPEIISHKCDGEEEFLVLACDGIWDCLTSQQVVDFVRRAIANGDALPKICEDLMLKCLAPDSELGGIGCDNMTVVIVALLNGRTVEEWQEWVKKRVDEKRKLAESRRRESANPSLQSATTPLNGSPTSLATPRPSSSEVETPVVKRGVLLQTYNKFWVLVALLLVMVTMTTKI